MLCQKSLSHKVEFASSFRTTLGFTLIRSASFDPLVSLAWPPCGASWLGTVMEVGAEVQRRRGSRLSLFPLCSSMPLHGAVNIL